MQSQSGWRDANVASAEVRLPLIVLDFAIGAGVGAVSRKQDPDCSLVNNVNPGSPGTKADPTSGRASSLLRQAEPCGTPGLQ
jgi:hypothetical protein